MRHGKDLVGLISQQDAREIVLKNAKNNYSEISIENSRVSQLISLLIYFGHHIPTEIKTSFNEKGCMDFN